jgi:hypothetical protein
MRRLLAFFDPLLGGAPFVVERHHRATRETEIRHNEADAREQLVGVVVDFRQIRPVCIRLPA